MFVSRGVRCASSFTYYKLTGSVQVTVNKPRAAVGAVHNSSIISCSQVCTHRVCVLPAGALQEKYVRSTTCKHVSPAVTAGKSASRLGFISPFSWRSQDRNTNNRLHSSKSLFCLGTETCIIGSSTNKLLSSALSTVSKQKQADWMRTDPATQVQKVLLSKSSQAGAEKPEPEEKRNKTEELKKVFKEYGAVGVSFHIGISIISLGIFYTAVSSGINMTAVLCKLGFNESVVQSKMAAGTSTFVLAYAVHKIFAPFRISITLVSVPLIVRYLRKTGLFKSSPRRL
ncbi:protein FAM210B, mitochondrial [Ictalurus punctatus]|uniref:Protein FAM210B, mitochondrial n=1 Tax=Ictalurus punctatus TaxID=7998 RepID=A0A2D0S6F5_ICTPU|nr:protein FAM210B, mitochondrial [Ictalurus punctatus]